MTLFVIHRQIFAGITVGSEIQIRLPSLFEIGNSNVMCPLLIRVFWKFVYILLSVDQAKRQPKAVKQQETSSYPDYWVIDACLKLSDLYYASYLLIVIISANSSVTFSSAEECEHASVIDWRTVLIATLGDILIHFIYMWCHHFTASTIRHCITRFFDALMKRWNHYLWGSS